MSDLYAAMLVTEENYRLYTELSEDTGRIPLEKEEVLNNYMIFDSRSALADAKFVWMTPETFNANYVIVDPETEDTFAVVQHK